MIIKKKRFKLVIVGLSFFSINSQSQAGKIEISQDNVFIPHTVAKQTSLSYDTKRRARGKNKKYEATHKEFLASIKHYTNHYYTHATASPDIVCHTCNVLEARWKEASAAMRIADEGLASQGVFRFKRTSDSKSVVGDSTGQEIAED